MDYKRYLKSKHWRGIKEKIYQKYKKCQKCGKRYDLQVHHTTYENLGNEKLQDLLLLCRRCHYKTYHRHRQKDWRYYRPSDLFAWVGKRIG